MRLGLRYETRTNNQPTRQWNYSFVEVPDEWFVRGLLVLAGHVGIGGGHG